MDNINENDVFSFGDTSRNDLEYQDSIDFDEKDLENEDIFKDNSEEIVEPEYATSQNQQFDPFAFTPSNLFETETSDNIEQPVETSVEETPQDVQTEDNMFDQPVETSIEETPQDVPAEDNMFDQPVETPVEETPQDVPAEDNMLEQSVDNTEENFSENNDVSNDKIEISDTPIEELNKLTEYNEEKIDKTDINSLFDRLSINVQDASEIFKRNTEMKKKIDNRFEDLRKLQLEIEKSKKKQKDEIDLYKKEVLDKLSEKKDEIESRLNTLKDLQVQLEKEREEFEEYKKEKEEEIERVQQEIQDSYDERREELEHIEDVLRKQRDDLDDKRSQLNLDRIQYEADKNALANNVLKFNEVVDSFTKGMNSLEED